MLQFICSDGSDIEEDKYELIDVENMCINLFDRICDEDVERVAFIII